VLWRCKYWEEPLNCRYGWDSNEGTPSSRSGVSKYSLKAAVTIAGKLYVSLEQDRRCTYNVAFRRRRAKAMSITYSGCVFVVLGIQHEMRRNVVCGLLPLQHFSTLSHKRHNFRKKKLLNTKSVFWFSVQLLFETVVILRRIQRDMIKNFVSVFM